MKNSYIISPCIRIIIILGIMSASAETTGPEIGPKNNVPNFFAIFSPFLIVFWNRIYRSNTVIGCNAIGCRC